MTELSYLVENGTGVYSIDGEEEIKINADKNSKYSSLYFKNNNDKESLQYSKENKNLIITNGVQRIILENYFTTTSGYATKSAVKNIVVNDEKYSIIDNALINSADLGYIVKPNKKNIITGTAFNDVIDMSTSAKKKGYTINTNSGNDIITGSVYNDKITGGVGNDTITTIGGSDTIVLTGKNYGHDVINSSGSKKVTINLSSFDANNIDLDENDLIYTTNDNSSFIYKDFLTETSADLWIKAGKKKYNLINKTSETVDYSKNTKNKVIFLSSDNAQTYNGSKKGENVVYSGAQTVSFNYQGAKDKYFSYGNSDDNYSAKITKTTSLVINDESGNDTIILNNSVKDLTLFFDADVNSETIGDLVIYNKKAVTYTALTKAVKSDKYTGGIDIKAFFDNGNIETVKLSGEEINLENWAYYVDCEVKKYLKNNNFTCVEDVYTKGKKSQRKALTNIFKSLTYQKYLNTLSECYNQTDYVFSREGDNLIYTVDGNSTTIDNFFLAQELDATYYALDENGKLKEYTIYSQPVLEDGEEYIINDETMQNTFYTDNYSTNTLIFEDKAYSDFYNDEGDPLIKKSGKDLVLDDISIKNVDGYDSEIQIIDKNNETKNVIIGTEEVNGTFESEIIIGSNAGDTINPNGGNDLIYTGMGKDTLNFIKGDSGEATGKNTANMTGIGGTELLDTNPVSAISVYDAGGDDTYNTSFDVGLYIEDFGGNDTLNITDTAENLMFFFDVVNPNHASENPTLYTDLFICDKAEFNEKFNDLRAAMLTSGIDALQGNIGYAWIDDYYGGKQKIETVTFNENELNLNYNDTESSLNALKQNIQAWLSGNLEISGYTIQPEGDYQTAWAVLEGNSLSDKFTMLNIYKNANV